MVERAIGQAGFKLDQVLQAANGEEALQILRLEEAAGTKIELIVSDINMPVMDGLQFLEQKQREKLADSVPIVMITTEGGEAMVRRAMAAGAKGYITKPFVPDSVKAQILAALSRV